MKVSELAMSLMRMEEDMDKVIDATRNHLRNQFQSSNPDNETATKESNMHDNMGDFIIVSRLNSRFKESFDQTKKDLDNGVTLLDQDPSSTPGMTINLHESNVFRFSKKQNKDSETTLITDLLTELARAGIEKSVIDTAMKAATKPKRGNVYYQVTTVED